MVDSTSEYLVRGTAWLSALLYFLSLLMPHARVSVSMPRLRRYLYSGGWLVLLVHIALAFHFYHHWSHDDAWQRTQEQSGYGNGIYANYALIVVWGLDVLWSWLASMKYQSRPRWIGVCIQGFLLFMWFFATTIFAIWPTSLIGWGLCFILLILALNNVGGGR
jgi:hypothetical protein